MASAERSLNCRFAAQRDIFAVTVSFGVVLGFVVGKVRSLLRFHLNVFRILERQERHEVGVMHDEGFSGALHQVALSGMGCDDVAHRIWNPAFERQGNSRERMPESFTALALTALAIWAKFVFQQLADISQDRPCKYDVGVDRQGAAHERVHGLGAVAGDVHHAALMLHESDRAVGDEKREWNLVQVVGLQRTALQRFDPGLCNLFTQLEILNPVDLRPKALDGLSHTGVRWEPLRLSWHDVSYPRLHSHGSVIGPPR